MQPPHVPTGQTRWRIPPILALTVLINYLDRNNLALAIPRIAQDFGWSDREIGANGEVLLAAFFISYALSNMLLSPWAERFGPKRSVMVAIAAFSIVTILSALFGASFVALIVLRLLLGLGEGVHIPMLSAITSRWFLPGERSRANALWGGGILVATAIAPILIIPLIQALGWRSTFAALGVGGMIISLPLVYWLVPPDAAVSTWPDQFAEARAVVSAPTYRRDPKFWLAVVGGSLNAFCAFGLLNWLPTYFNRAKNIDFAQLGWPLAVIFATGIVGIGVMAYWGDKLQRRIQLAAIGFLLAGVMVYLASTTTQFGLLVAAFAIAVFCQSAYGAQEYAIVQRLLPPHCVGSGTGLYNGLAVLLGGVGGSLIPGSIVAATGSFDAGMLSLVVGAGLAAIAMVVLSRYLKY